MPSTATQRRHLTEFIEVTKAKRESAQQYLRDHNYNLDAALNQYFVDSSAQVSAAKLNVSGAKEKLQQMFDDFVDFIPEEELERDESGKPIVPDTIGVGGFRTYIRRLGANPDSYEMFVVHDIVQASEFATVTRAGFVDGWARVFQETGGNVAPDWASHQRYVRARINEAATIPAKFKALYDQAFEIGREPGQKALRMVFAVAFWDAFFGPTTTHPWRTARVDWLEAWKRFLGERFGVTERDPETGEPELVDYKRTVSKDLWSQTRLFVAKTLEDDSLGFWSEEQAWPGVIDEFVLWCREKGVVGEQEGGRMATDE